MYNLFKIILVTSFLGGCANHQPSLFNKENLGGLLGGAAGAWAGSTIGKGSGKIVATAAGALLGGLVGSQLGNVLDEQDKGLITNTTHRTLETAPSYTPSQWRNPDNGHHGEIVAHPVYQQNHQSCRDFTQTIFIDGRAETAKGRACRQNDGTWKIIS